MALERLQKIMAAAGVASRRKSEEMILAGRVTVNGTVVTALGDKADLEKDHIKVDGKLLQGEEHKVYILVNKPKGVVSTVTDPEGRPTVMDLVRGEGARLYPVGRLDYLSEGLLLLTNDGALAEKLTRASSHVPKTYLVKVSGKPPVEAIQRLRQGILLPPENRHETGKPQRAVRTAPAEIHLSRDAENPWYEVTLTEGRNRQIRRMFKQVGFDVEKIRRVRYGPLELDVEPGEHRRLAPAEVEILMRAPRSAPRRDRYEREEQAKTAARAAAPSKRNFDKPRSDKPRFDKPRTDRPRSDAPAGDRPKRAFAPRPERSERPAGPRKDFRTDRPRPAAEGFRSERPAREGEGARRERPTGPRKDFRTDRPRPATGGFRSERPARASEGMSRERPAGPAKDFRTARQRPIGETFRRPAAAGEGARRERPAGPRKDFRTDRPRPEGQSFQRERPARPGTSDFKRPFSALDKRPAAAKRPFVRREEKPFDRPAKPFGESRERRERPAGAERSYTRPPRAEGSDRGAARPKPFRPGAGKPGGFSGRPSSRPSSGRPSSGRPSSGRPSSGRPSSGRPSSGRPSRGPRPPR